MSYIFLSHILSSETPSYGNKDRFSDSPQNEIIKGASANTSSWNFTNNHIGTHIDLPFHFDADGKKYEDYAAEEFIYDTVSLVDIPCNQGELIQRNSYYWGQITTSTELLLIRTGYETHRKSEKYWNDNPGIAPELCDFLITQFSNLRCIGFDFISLSSANHKVEGRLAHSALLKPKNGKRPVLIIEDMTLVASPSKIVKVIVAPLRVKDSNGGAVTVIAEI
jgi:kynurenine formamidase